MEQGDPVGKMALFHSVSNKKRIQKMGRICFDRIKQVNRRHPKSKTKGHYWVKNRLLVNNKFIFAIGNILRSFYGGFDRRSYIYRFPS